MRSDMKDRLRIIRGEGEGECQDQGDDEPHRIIHIYGDGHTFVFASNVHLSGNSDPDQEPALG